jgi:arsenate reductase
MKKPKVAFVCVHNSCRSQIAEALGKKFASSIFDSYSCCTEAKTPINPDAVRLIKAHYDIDMEETQYPKLFSELPDVNIVIIMEHHIDYPFFNDVHFEGWGLKDPQDKDDDEFLTVIQKIEKKVLDLAHRIQTRQIDLRT